ncbi:DNA glycosylase AlkZ-like family protein [Actinocorallia populi]|uniref:DNA glycosylase AlkZ-like family protein n=1 Tax=Actinocorallia populi TaxID=2079200 RepID=UPI000D092137|nr:crosslink repair DNA glycosylase YcaQ family protein [Actinocorallia populi]
MDSDKLRAFWAARQGLDGSLGAADPAEVLARTGWARSAGGFNPYLTLFSRAGTGRRAADEEMAGGRIGEIPTVRGQAYVLPEEDYGLGLRTSEPAARAEVRASERHGVDHRLLDKVVEVLYEAIGDTPTDLSDLDLAGLLPEGEAGEHTRLAALALLQTAGAIRRVPLEGRLDRPEHGYTRWADPPPEPEGEDARLALAERYWAWIGAASLEHFRRFSGLSEAAARSAVEPLGLHRQVDGDLLIRDVDEFGDYTPPRTPSYALVSALDGLHRLRHDLGAVLDPEHAGLRGLPAQPVFDRGRVVGFWNFDADDGTIAWTTWTRPDDALYEAVERAETFIRDELADVRGTAPDSVRPHALV